MNRIQNFFSSPVLYIVLLIIAGITFKVQRDYEAKIRHLYVASAFFISELPHNKTMVRALAVVEKSLFDPNIRCDLDGKVKPARVRRMELYIGCKWGVYFIECPTLQAPNQLHLMGDKNLRHEVQITHPDTKPRGFVVCFSRMFNYERWQSGLAALEFYKFHGVDLMVIPIMSVIKEMYTILREYETEGSVRLKRAAMVPNIAELDYNPNSEVDWFNQVLNFDECLYEYRESAEFIAFADLDDLMIPRNSLNLYTEMTQLAAANPHLASFEFSWHWASAITPSEPEKFSLNGLVKSTNVLFSAPNCGKPVVRPKRVQEAFIHHPDRWTFRGELLPGFQHQWFKENTTQVIHLRHLFEDSDPTHPNTANTFFGNDPRYVNVHNEFEHFLRRRPVAREAFLRLPTKMRYYDATHKCLRNTQFQRCHSAIICAPEKTDNLPPCVVLETKTKRTAISSNWIVHSSESPQFVHKTNCLM
ncbi:Glycosyltransferase family 92 protein [Aphelenchoides besseyi]|nr:Glycosyltransferase family 92 protein [Aphelenchoides besseyi]KAI6198992.1 Glycosyltransferase family 92 protein [Aphelenchoides besseyi]